MAAALSTLALRGAETGAVRHLLRRPAGRLISFHSADRSGHRELVNLRPLVAIVEVAGFDDLLASTRRRLRGTVVVALVDSTPAGVRQTIRLLSEGVLVCPRSGDDMSSIDLAEVIRSGLAGKVIREVFDAWHDPPHRIRRSFLQELWVGCWRPVRVCEAARIFHVDATTLRRHLRTSGLPAPAALIAWGRLFHAASLLEDPARTVEQIAHILDFPSDQALRQQVKRYTGTKPTSLRRKGWGVVVDAYLQCLAGDAERPAG